MKSRWIENAYSSSDVHNLVRSYGIPRPIATAMTVRGVTQKNIGKYLNPCLNNLSSPFDMPGLEKAAERLWIAINKNENILIHGDFDVDGITASALLVKVLTENGAKVDVFIPQRFDTGYGFSPESLERACKEKDYQLLITVDCGITSVEAVDLANTKNIDVIITDHHEQAEFLPKAYSIINPKIFKGTEDLKYLAGVGVAFKLADAFIKYGTENQLIYHYFNMEEVLDLVALGTVADIVPLIAENRILAKQGIKRLNKQIRPGIVTLCEIANVSEISANKISYKIAPHINAAGRLGDPKIAYDLLITNSIVSAMDLSKTLQEYNLARREKENDIYTQAQIQISQKGNNKASLLAYGENWHQGIIGNVASRISRGYNCPSIVLTIIDGEAYGSGRSIPGVNLVEVLSSSSDILNRYGGHPMAVGLSLDPENIPLLEERFEEAISCKVDKDELTPKINFDGDLYIHEIDNFFFDYLEQMEPFGYGNEEPIFRLNDLNPTYVTTAGAAHSRGYVKDANGSSMSFIFFNELPCNLPKSNWNILATPQINTFNSTPQLKIIEVEPSY